MRTVLNLSSRDIQNNDTAPYNKFADTTVTANVESTIGEYVNVSGVKATWGGGKLYVVMYDDTTTAVRIDGTFKFYVVGPSGATVMTHEVSTRLAGPDGKDADTDLWAFLPEGSKYAPKGGKLRITFIPDRSDTIDTTDCLFYALPIVVYS